MVEAVRAGATLREVGEQFGLSHEWVRKLVKRTDPKALIEGQKARLAAKISERDRAPAGKPLIERECGVCGTPFVTTNPRRVTCSSRCAHLWANTGIRFQSPERKRRRDLVQARANLRNPNSSRAHIRWAIGVLERAGEPLPDEYLARIGAERGV